MKPQFQDSVSLRKGVTLRANFGSSFVAVASFAVYMPGNIGTELRPIRPVEAPVLNRLGDVLRLQLGRIFQIGDRSCHF